MHWFISHLIYLSLTKPTMQQGFHPVRNICFTDTWHLVLLHILFVLEVKLGTFLIIQRCAFWFNLKYILCRCASRTLRMKLLSWCAESGWAFRVGSGRAWVCQNISDQFRPCMQNVFITLRKTTIFFRDVTSMNEVIVSFLQLILFGSTAAFFYSLLGLVSHFLRRRLWWGN